LNRWGCGNVAYVEYPGADHRLWDARRAQSIAARVRMDVASWLRSLLSV